MENRNNNANGGNNRDYAGEIDGLKKDMSEIKSLLDAIAKGQTGGEKHSRSENDAEGGREYRDNSFNRDNRQREYGREEREREKEYSRSHERHGQENRDYYNYRGPRPPRPPKPPKAQFLFGGGAGFDNLGQKIKETIESSMKGLDEGLKGLDEGLKTLENIDVDGMIKINLRNIMDTVKTEGENAARGAVSYMGGFEPLNNPGVYWATTGRSINEILDSIKSVDAEKVLAGIGSRQKLDIIMALLRHPMTVSELVAKIGFNTTGQAYHHLNYLLAADIVKEDRYSKGVYYVNSDCVKGIIMILSGIDELFDRNSRWDYDEDDGEQAEQPDKENRE